MTTKHGSEPRGLEILKSQQQRGRVAGADPRFGSRFGRLFDASATTFPEHALTELARNMVAEFDHGSVGMLQHNLGSYNDHIKAFGKDKVDGIPLPPSQDGGVRTIVSNPVDGLGMFKSGKNKAAA